MAELTLFAGFSPGAKIKSCLFYEVLAEVLAHQDGIPLPLP